MGNYLQSYDFNSDSGFDSEYGFIGQRYTQLGQVPLFVEFFEGKDSVCGAGAG